MLFAKTVETFLPMVAHNALSACTLFLFEFGLIG